MISLQLACLAGLMWSASAFAPRPTRFALTPTSMAASSGKGFGTEPPSAPKKKAEPEAAPSTSAAVTSSDPAPLNAGQKALAEMRRQRAEAKDAELRKVRDLLAADEQVQETPAAIPEKVAMRMGQRMLPFVGLPLFLGMGSFVGFWYMATYKNMEFQPAMVATTTVALLVVGLLGITYSVMSASWDPDREGDLLGADEFKNNLKNIQEGLSRSRENALLREKMAGLSDEELKVAVKNLHKKEQAELKRQMSLQSKLQDELE